LESSRFFPESDPGSSGVKRRISVGSNLPPGGSKSGTLLLAFENAGVSPLIVEFQQSSTVPAPIRCGNRAHCAAPAVRKVTEAIESRGLQWVG
jgi:hypothetical protein